jgi:D-beta-D-heptose 7-phosphate kinase/D-beta-D-heptose 1-phosphate adenosyltransferase
VIVDPKSSDFTVYHGATAITPNRKEAEAASGMVIGDDPALARAGRRLREVAAASYVLVTLGERGMALVGPDDALDLLPAEAREVFDVTGAGDTVLAYFGLGLSAGLSAHDAARIANAAAGIAVGKVGAAAVAPAEILADDGRRTGAAGKFLDLREAVARIEHERSLGRRIVFTNGCFDILHAGHVQLLEAARTLGDLLVVALNSDASIHRLKGQGRPVVAQADRVRVMCALDAVGIVIVFEQDTPLEAIRQIRPDVLVKGGDYSVETIVGASVVHGYGGRVATIPIVAGLSTTGLLAAIRGRTEAD